MDCYSVRMMAEIKVPYATFYAKNGLPIHVRPIRADDGAYLIDIFENMSSASRYARFNQTADHVSETRKWDLAESIAQADPENNFGLMAFADLPHEPDPPIGATRYVKLDDAVAEVAISLRDDYHGLGIGTRLMSLLVEEAHHRGLKKLVASVQNSNTGMWIVFERMPFAMSRRAEGTESNIEIDLTKREIRPLLPMAS